MKKIIFFLNCILNISLITAGFPFNALVTTPQGLVPIQELKVGDKVICFKEGNIVTHKTVTAVHRRKVDDIFKVTTHDGNVMYCCKDAQFYVPKTKEWQLVKNLTSKNWLLRQDGSAVKINSVEKLVKPTEICGITVDECSNFYVSEEGILVHNEPISITIGTVAWGVGATTVTFFEGVEVAAVAAAFFGFVVRSILKETTGVEVEGAKIDIGSPTLQQQAQNSLAHLSYDGGNPINGNTMSHLALRAVGGTPGGSDAATLHPDFYKQFEHSQGMLKSDRLQSVEQLVDGVKKMSATPPDNYVIHTPIPESQRPPVIIDPISDLKDPAVLIDPVIDIQGPPVLTDPIIDLQGPPVLTDPIDKQFDSPIVMNSKSPEQAAIDKILEGAIRGPESQKSGQYGKPGGFDGVNEDFEKIKRLFPGSKVEEKKKDVFVMILPDGTKVIARPSKEGSPTLEFQFPGIDRKIKLRYDPMEKSTQTLQDAIKKSDVENKTKERVKILASQILGGTDAQGSVKPNEISFSEKEISALKNAFGEQVAHKIIADEKYRNSLSNMGFDVSKLKTLVDSVPLSELSPLLKKMLGIDELKLDPTMTRNISPEQFQAFVEKTSQTLKEAAVPGGLSSLGFSEVREALKENIDKASGALKGAAVYCWGKIVIVVTRTIIVPVVLVVGTVGMGLYFYHKYKTRYSSLFKEYDAHGTCLHGIDKETFERHLAASEIILSKEQRRRMEVEYRLHMDVGRNDEYCVGPEKYKKKAPTRFYNNMSSKVFIEFLDDMSEFSKFHYLSEKNGDSKEVFEKKLKVFLQQRRAKKEKAKPGVSGAQNEMSYIIKSRL